MEPIPHPIESELARTNTTGRKNWSGVAVRLLQGVVYQEDNATTWEALLASHDELQNYFDAIGLSLIIDEVNSMAYLRQNDEAGDSKAEAGIPRLFRRQPLSYEQTLLCVLLREELRQFEETDVQNERCVVQQSEILSVWQSFFPETNDSVKLNRALSSSLRKLEELKFVRQFEKDPPSWEVCRILKARLSIDELETIRQTLLAEVAKKQKPQDFDRQALNPLSREE
jgi:hypothetical protein